MRFGAMCICIYVRTNFSLREKILGRNQHIGFFARVNIANFHGFIENVQNLIMSHHNKFNFHVYMRKKN